MPDKDRRPGAPGPAATCETCRYHHPTPWLDDCGLDDCRNGSKWEQKEEPTMPAKDQDRDQHAAPATTSRPIGLA